MSDLITSQMRSYLIDRQAAIDAIRGADGVVHYWSKQNAIKVLEELPSAQPDLQQSCNQLATDYNTHKALDALDCSEPTYEEVCLYCERRNLSDSCSRAERKEDE